MSETTQERQERLAVELQQMMVERYPNLDFSVGTAIYDLVIKPAAAVYANQDEQIDVVRNNMSLAQVLASDSPDATLVDQLLSNYGIARKQGTSASGLVNIYVNTNQNVYISANTTFTCNGINMRPVKAYVGVAGEITEEDTAQISYVRMREIGGGLRVFSVTASTSEAVSTVLSVGLRCTSTLANSGITKIELGSNFTGGSVEETTNELLERARTGLNARVVTGRDNIRSLLQNQEQVSVLDAVVFGMGDSLQLRDATNNGGVSAGGRLDVYVKTAPVPSTVTVTLPGTLEDGVWTIEIPADTYAGAHGVLRVAYGAMTSVGTLTPVLGYSPEGPWPLIATAMHARYSRYQTLSVQFETDAVPTGVTSADFQVTLMFMPGIDALQSYLNDEGLRSHAFDHVVKAVIPVQMEADVHIEYPKGATAPDTGVLRQTISDIINLRPVGTEALYTSDVVYACRLAFPTGIVRMPVNLRALIWLPDGSSAYTSSQHYIKPPEDTGISFRNCAFFAYPSDIHVFVEESL